MKKFGAWFVLVSFLMPHIRTTAPLLRSTPNVIPRDEAFMANALSLQVAAMGLGKSVPAAVQRAKAVRSIVHRATDEIAPHSQSGLANGSLPRSPIIFGTKLDDSLWTNKHQPHLYRRYRPGVIQKYSSVPGDDRPLRARLAYEVARLIGYTCVGNIQLYEEGDDLYSLEELFGVSLAEKFGRNRRRMSDAFRFDPEQTKVDGPAEYRNLPPSLLPSIVEADMFRVFALWYADSGPLQMHFAPHSGEVRNIDFGYSFQPPDKFKLGEAWSETQEDDYFFNYLAARAPMIQRHAALLVQRLISMSDVQLHALAERFREELEPLTARNEAIRETLEDVLSDLLRTAARRRSIFQRFVDSYGLQPPDIPSSPTSAEKPRKLLAAIWGSFLRVLKYGLEPASVRRTLTAA